LHQRCLVFGFKLQIVPYLGEWLIFRRARVKPIVLLGGSVMFIRGMVENEECGPPFLPQSCVCVFDGTS
jgi:hypothetical protein